MFKKSALGLNGKILLATSAALSLVVGLTYVVFVIGYRNDTQRQMVEKASAFTAVATEAQNIASNNIQTGSLDTESLIAELEAELDKNGDFRNTRFYQNIPVVVGWTSAREAAKVEGIDFAVPAFNARNPDNTPEIGGFREQMLRDLRNSFDTGGEKSLSRVDSDTNTLHYMRAIELDASCMMCHGDPDVYDKDGDGIDPVGFAMEGWDIGDMHGAYEVRIPLDQLDSAVAGFIGQGLLYTVPVIAISFGGFFFLMRATLSKPLTAVTDRLRDIAEGEGDLTCRLNIQRGDEIGKLGHWFDVFLTKIHDVIVDVRNSTEDVASAATEIAASSEQISQGAGAQTNQIQQVSSAIEQMSASVVEVAQKSGEAANSARESGNSAREGDSVVAETIQGMRSINEAVEASAAAVQSLGRRGEEIGEIIGVINDIADQTNLLALNAAIEAARAGEHGRGFAVVADEVRKLADRTTKETDEIAQSIQAIQAETGEAVSRMNGGTEQVREGVERATSAGQSLKQIVEASQQVSGMIESIAAAAEEQSAAAEEVSRNVEQISSVTRQTSEGVREAASAKTQLSQRTEELRRLVGSFKVNRRGSGSNDA
ncbi:MAG: methyl-accepting chemotaxis protein [Planctomycetota bacterium]